MGVCRVRRFVLNMLLDSQGSLHIPRGGMVVQDIVKDLQQMAAQPELDLMSTQTHSSLSGGEYSPMSAVTSLLLTF